MTLSQTELDKLQLLLDQTAHIDYQYKKTRNQDRFNIFNILSGKFDEVNLHSRFLYELINPLGSHNCDNLFLNLFLNQLHVNDFDLSNVKVRREYRKIDLLITNKNQAIVIENKLWAIDQPAQLQRYYELLEKEGYNNIKIFYLSINGKDPEDHSIGILKQRINWSTLFATISYREDIEQWLENCIKESYSKPVLRETLIQYRALIWEISGRTMHKEEMDEIIEFLAQGENMVKAKKIAENWNNAKWFTEWYFWRDLDKIISCEYEIKGLQKYSSDNLNSIIHNRRNRNPYYGLMFKIGNYLDAEACIFIERGGEMESVYYGLTMVIGQTREQSGDIKFNQLATKISEFSEWFQETHWIGGNYCNPEINFNLFSDPVTLKLLNDEYRAYYISNLWQQIKVFLEKALNEIECLNLKL
jgi:hypothetical protein